MHTTDVAGIDNLQARREHLTEQFFLHKVLKEKSSLHYLLPIKHDLNTVNRLCHATNIWTTTDTNREI